MDEYLNQEGLKYFYNKLNNQLITKEEVEKYYKEGTPILKGEAGKVGKDGKIYHKVWKVLWHGEMKEHNVVFAKLPEQWDDLLFCGKVGNGYLLFTEPYPKELVKVIGKWGDAKMFNANWVNFGVKDNGDIFLNYTFGDAFASDILYTTWVDDEGNILK